MLMKSVKMFTEYCLLSARNFSVLLKILTGFSLCIAIVFIILSIKINPFFSWGLLSLIPLVFLIIIIYKKNIIQKQIELLRENWGKKSDKNRVFSEIEILYRNFHYNNETRNVVVDDQTWSDLNMDEIYSSIDRTLTNPGECILYSILRTPILSDKILKKRNEIIHLFQNNKEIREWIQLKLLNLGRQKGNGITSLVYGKIPPSSSERFLFSFMALLALVSIITVPFIWGASGFILVILPIYIVNLLITNKIRARLVFQLNAIRYLGSMIRIAQNISKIDNPDLKDYCEKLKKAASAAEKIASKTFLLSPENYFSSDVQTLLSAHIDTYFLRDVRIFYAVLDEMRTHTEDIRLIYNLIGELDTLQSVASYRTEHSEYTEPNFSDQEPLLVITNAIHPLLTNPVPNSINIRNKGISITGSNMAGKTTFLRTLGINVLLAQTIYTCFASYYCGNFFRIISLINESDNLIEGKSYYLMEAEHLLRMIKASQCEFLTLCLIDEPLGGTNSAERVIASFEILRYLFENNALVITATHDLELAKMLEFGFKSYHFTDDVDDKGLKFDFKLKEGITSTSNAIKLLKYLKYPEEIINQAMKKIASE